MTTPTEFAHTKYEISLFGITLTPEEENGLARAVEQYARSQHPEERISGAAVWSAEQMPPISDFRPVTMKRLAGDGRPFGGEGASNAAQALDDSGYPPVTP